MKPILRAILPGLAATFWVILSIECRGGDPLGTSQWFMRLVLPLAVTVAALVLFVRAGLGRADAVTQVLAGALLLLAGLHRFASWRQTI